MATLNPSIILAGTNPNLMQSFDQGQQAGERSNQIGQQNALRSLYQTQGAGIASGNQGALNALAAIDPAMSLGVQQTRLGMDATRQGMRINEQNVSLRAAELASGLDARQREQMAAAFERGAGMLAAAQTPEQRQMLLSQPGFQEAAQALGIPPEALTVENADTIIGAAVGAANAIKMNAGPEPTTSQRDYQFYAQQEQQAGRQPLSFNEWDTQGKQAAANQVNLNTGEGDKFYETLDKGQATMFQTLIDDGITAGRNIQTLNQMSGLLENAPTGFGGAVQTMLGEFGIPSEGLSELQALQALINQIVPAQRQPGSGPMSDADLALFKQSVPRIINQPGGNRIILDRMRGIAQYQAQQAQIAAAVADRQMTPAQGRKALADLANPLEGLGATLKDLPAAPVETAPAPVDDSPVWNPSTRKWE
jgi:hypothetical protein